MNSIYNIEYTIRSVVGGGDVVFKKANTSKQVTRYEAYSTKFNMFISTHKEKKKSISIQPQCSFIYS